MSIKISALTLSSFVGDVRPIWLESDEDLKFAPISWSCKGDAILLKTLGGCFHGQIRYGVIVTFINPGTATVTATLKGESYTCQVTSRERRDFSSETMNYYRGDLHT